MLATYEQLFALTENVPVSLACFEVECLKIVYANARFARLLGHDASALVGTTLLAAAGPELAQYAARYVQQMVATRRPVKFEHVAVTAGHAPRCYEAHLVPGFDAAGEVTLCYGLMSNVTSLREAVRRADETADRLRKFMDASVEGMVFHDGGKIVDVNAPLLRMVGYTANEVIGESPLKFIAADAQAEAYAAIGVSREVTYDSVLLHRSGRRIPVQFASRNLLLNGVSVRMSIVRDMTDRVADAARIHFLAMHDSLTGLANRVQLYERLSLLIEGATAARKKLAVMFIDIDHFKRINDSLGHAAGDDLLVTFGERLRSVCTDQMVLARLGGDEFVVALKTLTSREQVAQFGESLLAELAKPSSIQGRRMSVTASVGVAVFPDDGTSIQSLLKNADAAMYLAKSQGRATLRFFDASLARAADEALAIEAQLTDAVANLEFELFFQPQVREPDGALIGVEALIRWRHPEFGLIGPSQFIKIAEGLPLILPMGQWVLDEALRHVRRWCDLGWAEARVAVNLSSVQFRAAHFVKGVLQTLQRHGLTGEHLELEVTERMLTHDGDNTAATLAALSAAGISVAVDDFGTGYSSLSHLRTLPIDRLKIDQSFVRELGDSRDCFAITEAIIRLAASLDIQVIAEGVETEQQRAILRAMDVYATQGFLIARPMGAADFERWLMTASFVEAELQL